MKGNRKKKEQMWTKEEDENEINKLVGQNNEIKTKQYRLTLSISEEEVKE